MAGKIFNKRNLARLNVIKKHTNDMIGEYDSTSKDITQKEAADFAHGDSRMLIYDAIAELYADATTYYNLEICDIFDTNAVYKLNYNGEYYQIDYTITTEGVVTLGQPIEVIRKVQYLPSSDGITESNRQNTPALINIIEMSLPLDESLDSIANDEEVVVELIESDRAGLIPVRIIKPGWGSSGYYSETIIKRDIPKIFPKGTQMFWNHQTAQERASRPEGDLRDLAGVLAEDPIYRNHPIHGPGAYSYIRPINGYEESVKTLKPYIGLSIRAEGMGYLGVAEGRKGRIVTSMDKGESVDFVTRAGAGGQILDLFEAARTRAYTMVHESATAPTKEDDMTPEEVKVLIGEALTPLQTKITTLESENARLRDSLALRDASTQLRTYVESIHGLPKLAHDRVIKDTLAQAERDNDGKISMAIMTETAKRLAGEEIAYLGETTGYGRSIPGFGAPPSASDEATLDAEFEAMLTGQGLSESAAKVAARGRL